MLHVGLLARVVRCMAEDDFDELFPKASGFTGFIFYLQRFAVAKDKIILDQAESNTWLSTTEGLVAEVYKSKAFEVAIQRHLTKKEGYSIDSLNQLVFSALSFKLEDPKIFKAYLSFVAGIKPTAELSKLAAMMAKIVAVIIKRFNGIASNEERDNLVVKLKDLSRLIDSTENKADMYLHICGLPQSVDASFCRSMADDVSKMTMPDCMSSLRVVLELSPDLVTDQLKTAVDRIVHMAIDRLLAVENQSTMNKAEKQSLMTLVTAMRVHASLGLSIREDNTAIWTKTICLLTKMVESNILPREMAFNFRLAVLHYRHNYESK